MRSTVVALAAAVAAAAGTTAREATDLLLTPEADPGAPASVEVVAAPNPPLDLLPGAVEAVAEAERREEAAARAELRYGRDAQGAYASYRLKAGEAVYSSVVVRFTGRVHAADVNDLVSVIAERSGVRSFNDLPVGFEIKVPLEYLAAEFRPDDDARRRDYESHKRDVARYRNRQRAAALHGVVVVLDAGHGGNDRGASNNGVWESDYVYDIMCRIKRRLERETEARVLTLVKNSDIGYKVRDDRHLKPLRATSVLTDPPYRLEDPTMGVNLRWYLANSLYGKLVRDGTDPSRIVFTSVHADSLHPTVRGAMVYVPGEEYADLARGRRGGEYARFREVQRATPGRHEGGERRRDEGLSRELAGLLLLAFEQRGLPTHEQKPIRGSVFRNGREWLPAVLRANQIPARVLLEVCNLNHEADNELLQAPAFREAVAESYVAALLAYYGNGSRTLVARDRR